MKLSLQLGGSVWREALQFSIWRRATPGQSEREDEGEEGVFAILILFSVDGDQ